MVLGLAFVVAATVASSALQSQSTNLILVGAIFVGGIFAWRQKRGDFYKAVAEEKNEENKQLRIERDRLSQKTNIEPIVERLEHVAAALDHVIEMSAQVVEKVSDMNGSLRAHSTAMEALAQRIVVEEAARGLLHAAANPTHRHQD
jgi:ABC-type anion transport system duplicated permease subunit